MEFLDWLLILACITIAVGGFQIGFVAKMSSWIGTALGLFGAVLLMPVVLRSADRMNPAGRLGIVVLLALAGLLIGQMVGLIAGSKLSRNVPPGPYQFTDKVVGALSGILGVLLVMWLLLPTIANVPGWPAQQVRSSRIAQGIYDNMPRPPDWAQELNRLVGTATFPSVFNNIAPAENLGPSPESVTLPADVIERASAASVKVEGTACRRIQDGSGFVVEPGLVATNAHVVAGERRTNVITNDGETLAATVVAYDPNRDLALLRVPRMIDVDPLPMANPVIGETGAVFGHPGGQAKLAVTPAAIRQHINALGRDLYDQNTTRRSVLMLSARLAQGDSGGALVNTKGQVVGVAFAIAPDKPETAYALHIDELRELLREPHLDAVDTGACLAS